MQAQAQAQAPVGGGVGGVYGGPGGVYGGPPTAPAVAAGPGWRGGRFGAGGWGQKYGGHPAAGPCGGPWCCWPFLCILFTVCLAGAGIAAIQVVEDCSEDDDAQTTCTEYDAGYGLGVGLVILIICCCCCLCRRPKESRYDAADGTAAERAHMMAAAEQPPPPAAAPAPTVVIMTDPNKPQTASVVSGPGVVTGTEDDSSKV